SPAGKRKIPYPIPYNALPELSVQGRADFVVGDCGLREEMNKRNMMMKLMRRMTLKMIDDRDRLDKEQVEKLGMSPTLDLRNTSLAENQTPNTEKAEKAEVTTSQLPGSARPSAAVQRGAA
ncbi:hypothetical protein HAX54_014579, partial [Datura stramonium]|nr:hypothetical protein [Datura stramonium]